MDNKNDSAFPEWKKIDGWPQYEISSFGDVRSWSGPGFSKAGRLRPKYRKPSVGKDGYCRIVLSENSKQPHRRVEGWMIHRLVAEAFIPTTDTKLDVAHLDGNKQNNHVGNLKWCTRKENESHKIAHGTKAEGSRNGQSKLCERAVKAIRVLHRNYRWPQSVIADLFQIEQSNVSAIVLAKSWKQAEAQLAKDGGE